MNKVKLEKHFDEAEKLIDNIGKDSLKEVGRFLKGRLRRIININFSKKTGSLLKGVQDKVKFSDKINKEVYIGITKDVKHALWLHKGTGIRRHRSGKSVGKLHPIRFIDILLRENRNNIQNIIIKHFRKI